MPSETNVIPLSHMDENKSKALSAALAQIEKQFGKGSIMRMDAQAAPDVQVVPTGSLGLDIALGAHRIEGRAGDHHRARGTQGVLRDLRKRDGPA